MELSYPDGSPAEGVTVQIRAELTPKDNIYTIESVSRGGLVGFEIPFIPMSAQHVWLEVGELLGPLSFSHQIRPWCLSQSMLGHHLGGPVAYCCPEGVYSL